jgi:hypothetical protein
MTFRRLSMSKNAPLLALALGIAAAAFASPAEARIDFDRDGKSDFLWHNGATGEVRIWRMNNTTKVEDLGTTWFGQSSNVPNSTGWRVSGEADFNHDGVPDIFWHNGASGGFSVWYMGGTKGTNVVDNPGLVNGVAIPDNTGWRIVGIGDFTGDGNADLLWHHRDGAIGIWRLAGVKGNEVQSMPLITNAPNMPEGALTRVVGVADYNFDGVADILWQNPSTGQLTIWFITGGTTPAFNGSLNLSTSFSNKDVSYYRFVSTEDMNGDNVPDLVWHYQVTGETKIYYMTSGLSPNGTALVSGTIPDDNSNWRIVNGTLNPRQWRRGGNCIPFQSSQIGGSVTYPSGSSGVQFSGSGTAIECPVLKTTSGLNITNDNFYAIDLQFSVPAVSPQPQVSCTVNTYSTTTSIQSVPHQVGNPATGVTVGTGTVMVRIQPAAHTNWWRSSDWDYAGVTCSITNGTGPVTLLQYWTSEDGVFQKERIYPMSVCAPNGTLTTSAWGFRDGNAGGSVESETNGSGGDGGIFAWDCHRTLGTLNDKNTSFTMNYIPSFALAAPSPVTLTSLSSGNSMNLPKQATPAPGIFVTPSLGQSSSEFRLTSPGIGDIVLYSYRTF